jgi:hypothetical protein
MRVVRVLALTGFKCQLLGTCFRMHKICFPRGIPLTMSQVVQLLIERGCQYAARNNQGFTASDYAYS